MSEETMEPRTFEDLWLMRETSKEWFDGQLRYENIRKGAAPEVGAINSVSWHVVPTSDRVRVYKSTHVICEVRGSRSFSCNVENETVAEYRSMAEFRASEWWDLTMERFSGGDADASWLRAVELDGEEIADGEPQWIGYGPSTWVEMGVGSQYRDWLGNTRQNKGHETLSIRVERMSGELCLRRGEHEVEGTLEYLEEAVALMERLGRLGIEVGHTEIRVPIAERRTRMVTDDERREMARRLRECRGGWASGECYYTIIHVLGLPDTSREDGGAALYALLADLIEPAPERTCSVVQMDDAGNPPWNQSGLNLNSTTRGCSECGYPFGIRGHEFRFCPNCGARVVVE